MKSYCRKCNTDYVEPNECLCPAKAQRESIDTMNEILTIARKAGMEIEPVINITFEVKKCTRKN